jgi:alanine racemase
MTPPEHAHATAYTIAHSTAHTNPLATRIVDLGAIARIIGRIRDITATPILAVVKADGFGHGIIEVANTALEAGAAWLGVATVDEALAVRAAGIDAPVLCWLADPWCDLSAAVAAGVTISCANTETLEAIAALGDAAEVHLELDTGMSAGWRSRIGLGHPLRHRTGLPVGVGHRPLVAARPRGRRAPGSHDGAGAGL